MTLERNWFVQTCMQTPTGNLREWNKMHVYSRRQYIQSYRCALNRVNQSCIDTYGFPFRSVSTVVGMAKSGRRGRPLESYSGLEEHEEVVTTNRRKPPLLGHPDSRIRYDLLVPILNRGSLPRRSPRHKLKYHPPLH